MIFVSASSGSSAIDLDHRRIGHQVAVAVAAQDRGQVEAEAVDVVVVHPVAQAVEDHLADDRVVAVDRVAAAGVVAVVLAAVLQHVVDAVLQALEAERRAVLVAFGRVVEDDVEDHLDAGGVQRPDHLLELADLGARLACRRRSRGAARRSTAGRSPSSSAAAAGCRSSRWSETRGPASARRP